MDDIKKLVDSARDNYVAQRTPSAPASSGIGSIVESAKDSYIKQSQNPYTGPRREETPVLMAMQKNQKDMAAFNSWARRYNRVTSGFLDYDKKRNGRFTADASGGFGSEIDALIRDYENVKYFSGRDPSFDPLDYLQQIQKYIQDENTSFSDYSSALKDSGFSDKAASGWSQFEADNAGKKTEGYGTGKMGGDHWFRDAMFRAAGGGGMTEASLKLATDNSWKQPTENWTQEERDIYGFLYGTDREKADKFAIDTNDLINKSNRTDKIQAAEEFGAKHPVLAFAGNVGSGVAGAGNADFILKGLEKIARGQNTEWGFATPRQVTEAASGGASQMLNEKGGTIREDIPVLGGKGWGDVYQLGQSIAESNALASLVGPMGEMGAYLTDAVFFGNSASSAYDDAKQRGASDEQAFAFGFANGLNEALGEHFSIENLVTMKDPHSLMQLGREILKQAGVEGSEEVFTSLLNNWADAFVMKDKSQYQLMVDELSQEMSREDAEKAAKKKMFEDICFDFLGGAFSGGVSGGVQSTSQYITSNRYHTNTYGGSVSELVQEGMELNPNNKFVQGLQERLDSGRQIKGNQIAQLVDLNEQAITKQDMDTIRRSVTERLTELGETGNIEAVADALTRQAAGEKLTMADKRALSGSQYGQRVSNEMNPENIQSGGYASGWAQRMETNRVNADAYTQGGQADVSSAENATLGSLSKKYGEYGEAFQRNYIEGQDLQEYDFAFGVAYEMGKSGGNKAALNKTEYLSKLTPTQREIAYEIGEAAAKRAATVANNATTTQEQKPGQKPGTVQYSGFSISPNATHGNTEIRFEGKPSAAVQQALRDSGFQYSNKNKVWFGTGDNTQIAETIKTAMKQDVQSKEVQNGTEEVRLRQGAQRVDGENPGGAVHSVEEGAGGPGQGREAGGQPGDSGKAAGNVQERGKGLTLPKGFTGENLRQYSGQETREIKKAKAVARKHGVEITLFEGGNVTVHNEDGTSFRANAFIDGDHIYVRADHPVISADKLARHEAAHAQVQRGEINVKAVYDQIVEAYQDEQKVLSMLEAYALAHDMSGLDAMEIFEEILCDSVAEINSFGLYGNEESAAFLDNTRFYAEENERVGNETRGPPESTGIKFSIQPIVGKNGEYGSGVLLDTNLFDGVKPRDWGKVLGKFVYEKLAGTELTMYDQDGNAETVHLARVNDRVKKDGANNSHKVIDKLARYKGDNVKALATVHLSELLETSGNEQKNPSHNHQWLDENGWIYRTSYLMDQSGAIYEATLNIADGRNGKILYEINKIKRVDAGVVPSTVAGRGSLRTINSSEDSVAKTGRNVNTKFSRESIQQRKEQQFDIIQNSNPADDDYHTWIRSADEIMTFEESLSDSDWAEYDSFNPDYDRAMAESAIQSGKIRVYSSYKIGDGVFVSPSLMEAESYSGDGSVHSKVVNIDDVAWIDPTQGQYAPVKKNTGTKFSRETVDSSGRKLSERQQKYFKDSKVRDENGNLMVMYHGTPSGDFTVFRDGSYFTSDKSYADGYQNPNASMLRSNKPVSTPKTFEVYLDMKKPFDIRDPKARRIYIEDYIKGGNAAGINPYLSEAEYRKIKSIDWVEGEDLRDFLIDNEYDYDGLVLDEGGTGGYGESVQSRGKSYVIFNANQVKNVDNLHPTDSSDIRFSRENPTMNELQKENDLLRERVEILRGQMKLTTTKQVRLSDVDKVTQKILKDYQSKAEFGGVRNSLKELADSMIQPVPDNFDVDKMSSEDSVENVLWDRARGKAVEIARQIVGKSQTIVNGEELETFKSIKKQLHGTRISLTETADIADFNDFRKRNFGRFVLSKDGVPMDVVWMDLQDTFGKGFFPESITHPADQLLHIEELLNGMDAQYGNPFHGAIRENVEICANEIMDDLFSGAVRQMAPTFADRQAARLMQEKSDLIEKSRKRIAQLQQEKREIRSQFKEIRKEASARTRESYEVKKYRGKIVEKTKKLSDMLIKNSMKEHIPEALKAPVGEFLQSIDFTSKRQLAGGEATRKDLRYSDTLDKLRQVLQNQADYMNNPENGSGNDFYLDLPYGFAQEVQEHINRVTEAARGLDVGTNQVANMGLSELQDLDYILTVIGRSVSQVNKLAVNAHFASVVEASETTIREHGKLKNTTQTGKVAKFFQWDNATPYYAFKHLGGASLSIFEELQDGWDKMAMNTKSLIEFSEKAYTDKEVNAWNQNIKTVELSSGEKFQISVPQIMSLYCLMKREQAVKHLMGGGIRVGDIEVGGKKPITNASNYTLTMDDLANITGLLTNRQRQVADKLQEYMNTTGSQWGNEVSMERFGYRAFTEENYFPIQSDSNNLPAVHPDAKANDLFRLLNLSMTKSLTPNANNSIVLSNIFDVFADHMSDMSKYNALALPILDTMKWYNFKAQEKDADGHVTTKTVQKSIEAAFGRNANGYVINLLKDINGTHEGGKGTDSFSKKMVSNYKVAAVAGNLRVALLQPTAYVRASAVIDPKYLAKGLTFHMVQNANEAERYSGIAAWKSMGFYDTNIARGVRDQIKHDASIKEKFVEKTMKGAEWGDRLTWGVLWNACKLETRDKTGLKGEALMEATAKRFRDVVYQTQVVDSTMTRSQMMRDSGGLATLSTAFMSEPTLSYNMLLDVYNEYETDARKPGGKGKAWQKVGGKLMRTMAAYAVTNLAAALAEGLMDALRDDDDYETLLEKFKEHFTGNLIDDMNPITKLPYVKDVISILFDGFDSERMDVAWVEGLTDAYDAWKNPNATGYKKLYSSLKAASQVSGIPVSNIIREGATAYNNIPVLRTPVAEAWNHTLGIITGKKLDADERLRSYDPGEKNSIKYAFKDGYLTEAEAIREIIVNGLTDSSGVAYTENDAYFMVQGWKAGKDYSKYDKLDDAVIGGGNTDAAIAELTSHGVDEKDISSHIKSSIKKWYVEDDPSKTKIDRSKAEGLMKKHLDMDADEIRKTVSKWGSEADTGISFDEIKQKYMDDELTSQQAMDMEVKYGGLSRDEAKTKIQYWDFQKKYPDIYADDSWFDKYNQDIASSGTPIKVYMEYRNKVRSVTGEGKKERRMDIINSLPITRSQKDAFYLSEGWAESRIDEAPWR